MDKNDIMISHFGGWSQVGIRAGWESIMARPTPVTAAKQGQSLRQTRGKKTTFG
jgi:hypothetical protein